jgi:hypothetical protein
MGLKNHRDTQRTHSYEAIDISTVEEARALMPSDAIEYTQTIQHPPHSSNCGALDLDNIEATIDAVKRVVVTDRFISLLCIEDHLMTIPHKRVTHAHNLNAIRVSRRNG